MSIGDNIKKLREKKEMSQSDLSKKLGVSDKTISSWEINRTKPKLDMLEKICSTLDVPITELLPTLLPNFNTLKKVNEGKEKKSNLFDLYVDADGNEVYIPNQLCYINLYFEDYLKSDEEKDKLLDYINSYSMLNDDGKDKLSEHINLLLESSKYSNGDIVGAIEKIIKSM